MRDFKALIGSTSKFYDEGLPSERFALFAESAKSDAGPGDTSAIPTFFTIFRHGEFELLSKLQVELKQVLHAEQEYEFFTPLKAGEKVRFQTRLADVLEKKSKDVYLHFLIFETDFQNSEDGARLARARSTILYREKDVREKGGA